MKNKLYRVYHANGKPEDIRTREIPEIVRDGDNKMVAVKIGRRTIENPIQFWEQKEEIVKPNLPLIVHDDDNE